MIKIRTLLLICTVACYCSCDKRSEKKQDEQPQPDTASAVKKNITPEIKPVAITYHALRMKDTGRKVYKTFDKEQQKIILALNRIDAAHVGSTDTLVVPDTFMNDWNAYSVFPQEVAQLKDVKKIVFFSYPTQTYALYENGHLLKWGPTNMGKKSSKTPTGLFFTNWKGKEVHSSVDDEWILKWNFNVQNKMGVGWHQYSMPGYPASHSCMRLYAEDAEFMYNWADQWRLKNGALIANGTPVIIFGAYPFGQRKPWRNLLDDPNALKISATQMDELIQPHLEKIMAEQQKLDEVKALTQNNADSTIAQ